MTFKNFKDLSNQLHISARSTEKNEEVKLYKIIEKIKILKN